MTVEYQGKQTPNRPGGGSVRPGGGAGIESLGGLSSSFGERSGPDIPSTATLLGTVSKDISKFIGKSFTAIHLFYIRFNLSEKGKSFVVMFTTDGTLGFMLIDRQAMTDQKFVFGFSRTSCDWSITEPDSKSGNTGFVGRYIVGVTSREPCIPDSKRIYFLVYINEMRISLFCLLFAVIIGFYFIPSR